MVMGRRQADVEDTVERLPTPWPPAGGHDEIAQTSGEIGSAALVAALTLLARRGTVPRRGRRSSVMIPRVLLRYERRCCRFHCGHAEYLLRSSASAPSKQACY